MRLRPGKPQGAEWNRRWTNTNADQHWSTAPYQPSRLGAQKRIPPSSSSGKDLDNRFFEVFAVLAVGIAVAAVPRQDHPCPIVYQRLSAVAIVAFSGLSRALARSIIALSQATQGLGAGFGRALASPPATQDSVHNYIAFTLIAAAGIDMDEKRDRVALVTGGSRGIGQAIVEELARTGWKVAFTYNSSAEAAEKVADGLRAEGRVASAYRADVRDYQRASEVVKQIEESLGPISLLVNNAGIKRDGAFMRMDPEKWKEVLDTNLGGTFNYSRSVIMSMVKRGSGAIINIVSVSGMIGLAGQTNYSASKAGVIGFTRALAKEVARFKVRVNAIAPGFIETDMLADIPEAARKTMFAQIPMGSPGSPMHVAQTVVFLAGDGAGYITGQVLPVDGGMV